MRKISDFLNSRENNFDFIRFMAATAVIYSHAHPIVQGENDWEPFYVFTKNQSSIGGAAVAVFFIISGFLITQSFIKTQSIRSYLLSRALRIFPALAVMSVCTVFIIGPLATWQSFRNYFSSGTTYEYLWNAIAFTNHNNLPGVFTDNAFQYIVNGSLWSLPYEILFYLLVPAVGLILSKQRAPAMAFIFVSLVMICSGYLGNDHLLEMGNYFLCGSLYYLLRNKIILHPLLAMLAIILIYVSIKIWYFNLAFGLLGGYLVFFVAFRVRMGATNFARYGDFSYGIYIWAFPIQQVISQAGLSTTPVFNFLISFPVILLLGVLSWHFIEKRALKAKSGMVSGAG